MPEAALFNRTVWEMNGTRRDLTLRAMAADLQSESHVIHVDRVAGVAGAAAHCGRVT